MKLLYFAWVRQKIGKGEEDMALPADVATVRQLMDRLAASGANYAEAFRDPARLRCAVNQHHADMEARIGPRDEIAFFPPVTGG